MSPWPFFVLLLIMIVLMILVETRASDQDQEQEQEQGASQARRHSAVATTLDLDCLFSVLRDEGLVALDHLFVAARFVVPFGK